MFGIDFVIGVTDLEAYKSRKIFRFEERLHFYLRTETGGFGPQYKKKAAWMAALSSIILFNNFSFNRLFFITN